jgi:hypothetical protein
MKCALDTNILDWIVDDIHGPELLNLVERHVVSAIVAADNAYEVHRISDGKGTRRDRLDILLQSHFSPLATTHVPLAGIARAGLARIATTHVMRLRAELAKVGIKGLDSIHLINASLEGCDMFVTCDKGILKKRGVIRRLLGVECVDPTDLLRRLDGSTREGAG